MAPGPLVVRPRAPALARLVASMGYYAGGPPSARLERSLPNGSASLMVNLLEDEFRTYEGPDHASVRRVGGAMLAGPRTAPTVIDTAEQRRVVTVSFRPGGAAPFFAVPLVETRDRLVELRALWGRDGEVLRERLCEAGSPEAALQAVEAVLLDHVRAPLEADPAVAVALAALERGGAVSEITARLGLPPKRFVQRFLAAVGLTPKRYSRVRRLQRLLTAVHRRDPVDWADVALRHGYFDQAHLINDFRRLTGMTPTAYLAAVGGEQNHVPLA